MSDAVWRRAEIESPCVKLCVVDPKTRLCLGCHRTIDEIATWSSMSPEARRAIMEALPARAEANRPVRRGGRAARRERG
jgi:predicted Fe-S protein YdhL (DUF1289 family)